MKRFMIMAALVLSSVATFAQTELVEKYIDIEYCQDSVEYDTLSRKPHKETRYSFVSTTFYETTPKHVVRTKEPHMVFIQYITQRPDIGEIWIVDQKGHKSRFRFTESVLSTHDSDAYSIDILRFYKNNRLLGEYQWQHNNRTGAVKIDMFLVKGHHTFNIESYSK